VSARGVALRRLLTFSRLVSPTLRGRTGGDVGCDNGIFDNFLLPIHEHDSDCSRSA
jgi:hypothetical protein